MPQKVRRFSRTKFTPEVIARALTEARRVGADGLARYRRDSGMPEDLIAGAAAEESRREPDLSLHVETDGDVEWTFDTAAEFFSEYRKPNVTQARFEFTDAGPASFHVWVMGTLTQVKVHAPTRGSVEEIFAVFEDAADTCRLPEDPEDSGPPLSIFIGHGHSYDWRELYEHLRDLHRLDVQSFETHPRAGYTAKEVLERIAGETSLAVLVHTAEDEQSDDSLRARENVVHETGLFQGRIGFARAIIVREEGCEPFSNVAGVQEIRYAAGAIRQTFGDVLAVIRREFG